MQLISSDLYKQLQRLPEPERDYLVRAGLYEAAQARILQLQEEIDECLTHIRQFKQRYGVSFQQFENDLLPTLDSLDAHDDYNDWFYWENVLKEKEQLVAEFMQFAE